MAVANCKLPLFLSFARGLEAWLAKSGWASGALCRIAAKQETQDQIYSTRKEFWKGGMASAGISGPRAVACRWDAAI